MLELYEKSVNLHGKIDFTEVSKKVRYRSENNIIDQNNYVGNSRMMSNSVKNFDISNQFEHFT